MPRGAGVVDVGSGAGGGGGAGGVRGVDGAAYAVALVEGAALRGKAGARHAAALRECDAIERRSFPKHEALSAVGGVASAAAKVGGRGAPGALPSDGPHAPARVSPSTAQPSATPRC